MKTSQNSALNHIPLTAWQEQLAQTKTPQIKHQLVQQQQTLWPRLAAYYDTLQHMPRRMRRSLQRQWKQSLAGVALLLTLGQAPALAAIINVTPGAPPGINNTDSQCSLIEAIDNANDNANGGVVHNDCAAGGGPDLIILPPNSIQTLVISNNNPFSPSGLPEITSTITIAGQGSTITRNNGFPQFRIFAVSAAGDLTLRNTTVSGGESAQVPLLPGGPGGGILNGGKLTLVRSTISGNSASGIGGGVASAGSLTMTNSTVSGNSASLSNYGGGLAIFGGAAILTDSTISGNSARRGGGVFAGGNFNGAPTLTLNRTLISGNTATDPSPSGAEIFLNNGFSTVTVNSTRNLFGHSGLMNAADAFDGFTPSASDRTAIFGGTNQTALAAILSPLANNGGPTRTHALPLNSPALDVTSVGCPATDQRGIARPNDGNGDSIAQCDAGAFELELTCAGLIPTIVGTQGNDNLSGTIGNDVIQGLGGNDTIFGGLGGNDTICGGFGNDSLNGGIGNDRLNGDAGVDRASFPGFMAVTVDLANFMATGQGSDTLTGIENVTGSGVADFITGDAGANQLTGGDGNDQLIGAGGNDNLLGGNHDDILNADPGAADFCDGGNHLLGDMQSGCDLPLTPPGFGVP